ncbi:MAG: PQQ-binding-like beta-propeller repeat protein, partial [Halobacterium sp.]
PRSRRAFLASGVAAAAGAFAGCSLPSRNGRQRVDAPAATAWATRYGGSRQTAASDVAGVTATPSRQWRDLDFPQYEGGVFTPSGGGFVVDTHAVTDVSPDGSERWRDDTGYYGPPLLTDGAVVVNSMREGLVALDRASGERAWTATDAAPLAVAAGRVAGRGGSEGLDAVTPGGSAAWSHQVAHTDGATAVAAGDGTVVAAFSDRTLTQEDADHPETHSTVVALDAESGQRQWRFGVAGSVERLAVRNGRTYVATGVRDLGALLYAVSLSDGEAVARRSFPRSWPDGLTMAGSRVVVASGTALHGYDPDLTGPDWRTSLPSRADSLAASMSLVYATWSRPDDGTVLAAFNAADGTRRWRTTLPPDNGYVAGVTDGRVFVAGNDDTGLYALE